MTQQVNIRQPVALATPVQATWAHEQSDPSGKGGICGWAQPHGLPLPKADVAIATTDCPTRQEWRLMLIPPPPHP